MTKVTGVAVRLLRSLISPSELFPISVFTHNSRTSLPGGHRLNT